MMDSEMGRINELEALHASVKWWSDREWDDLTFTPEAVHVLVQQVLKYDRKQLKWGIGKIAEMIRKLGGLDVR